MKELCQNCGYAPSTGLPSYVIIRDVEDEPNTGRVYRVKSVIESGSRGREYLLLNKRNLVERVCHAPPADFRIRSVTTSGEVITYLMAIAGESFRGQSVASQVQS